MPAQAPFTKHILRTLSGNFTDLVFNDSGGITQTEGTPTGDLVPFTVTGDGAAGTFGFDYDTAATAAGGNLLTLGRSGGLATLNFDRTGHIAGFTPFAFDTSVTLPGNWTHEGTSSGDYELVSIAPGSARLNSSMTLATTPPRSPLRILPMRAVSSAWTSLCSVRRFQSRRPGR